MDLFQRGHPFLSKNSGEMLKGKRDPPRIVNLAPTRSTFETRISFTPRTDVPPPNKPTETLPKLPYCCSSSEFESALKLTTPVVPLRPSSESTSAPTQNSQILENSPLPPPYNLLGVPNVIDAADQSSVEESGKQEENEISEKNDSDLAHCCSSSEFEPASKLKSPMVPSRLEENSEQEIATPCAPVNAEQSPLLARYLDLGSHKPVSEELTANDAEVPETPRELERQISDHSVVTVGDTPVESTPEPNQEVLGSTNFLEQTAETHHSIEDSVKSLGPSETENSLSEQYKKLIEEACDTTEEEQKTIADVPVHSLKDSIQENWSELSLVRNEENSVSNEIDALPVVQNPDYLSFKSNPMDIRDPFIQESAPNGGVEYTHQPLDNEEDLEESEQEEKHEEDQKSKTEPVQEYEQSYTMSDRDKELIAENNLFFATGQDSVLPAANELMSWSQMLEQTQTPSAPILESARASESEMKEVEDYLNEFDSLVNEFELVDESQCEEKDGNETIPETM